MQMRRPKDDYYVLMWTNVVPVYSSGPEMAARAIERFRELGCNGGTAINTFICPEEYKAATRKLGLDANFKFATPRVGPEVYVENNFPLYVENMCRSIYLGWGGAKHAFRKQYAQFDRERDRSVFVRTPCVNDPAVAAAMNEIVDTTMNIMAPARDLTLLYDLRDECSVTSFVLASDACFCPHCMERMRDWLKASYGDLQALNGEWDTDFGSWDEVHPLTSQEVLERREAGSWNFAPWHDHRAFMNEAFARVCREYGERVRRHDPEALIGLEGTQCPSPFGGYDFSLLAPAVDWMEPYIMGRSLDCLRAFKPRREYPVLRTTGLGVPLQYRRAMLWAVMYQAGGYGGAIIWNSSTTVDESSPDLDLKPGIRDQAEMYLELRGGVAQLLQRCEEVSSPVAIHYSQASLNADLMTSLPCRWQSVAAYQNSVLPAHKSRMAWWELFEDRGLRPLFVSARQIEQGELRKGGFKILLLPRSIAVSDREAEEIAAFVEGGGTVAADSFAGRMDEHCRERETGALDGLFGVKRIAHDAYHASEQSASFDWDASPDKEARWGSGSVRATVRLVEEGLGGDGARALGCTEMTDTGIGFVNRPGEGCAVLFNAAPLDYSIQRRMPGEGRSYQRLFGDVVERAGVQPEVIVRSRASGLPVPGWQVWPFRHGEAWYYGVAADLGIVQDMLGAGRETAQAGGSREVTLEFRTAGHIYEARSGRYMGEGSKLEETLDPLEPRLYCLLPYRVASMELAWAGGRATARIETDGTCGEHVFRFDVLDGDGNTVQDAGANVVAAAGQAEWAPESLPAPPCSIRCRDVATGVGATTDAAS